jgi:hypothetical protein
MADKPKIQATYLDGLFSVETVDASGELVKIDGVDISNVAEGRCWVNWEHLQKENDDDKRQHVPGSEIVGKVIYAKKLFTEDDCENERQRYYWDLFKLPMIYGIIRLFNAQEGHESAKHIAATIRDSVENEEPLTIGYSIEGNNLGREKNVITKALLKAVAITLAACNKASVMAVLRDEYLGIDEKEDPEVLKNEIQVSKFKSCFSKVEIVYSPTMLKALEAGSYDAAPSQLTQGAALQSENLGRSRKKKFRIKVLSALSAWDGEQDVRKFIKAALPDVSEEFLQHFKDVVDDHVLNIKKSEHNSLNVVLDELEVELNAYKRLFE